MKVLKPIVVCCIFFVVLCPWQEGAAYERIKWRQLQKGLEFASVTIREQNKDVVLVRVIPRYFRFALLSSKVENHAPLPITAWQKKQRFAVAINASMFSKDAATSVGYFKTKKGFNNKVLVDDLGAIFCADPYNTRMLNATLIDRNVYTRAALKNFLLQYREAVQNYRLIDDDGDVVWKSYSTTPTTMTAVGIDRQKRLLFIFSEALLTPTMLATLLTKLPLHIRTTMYTEGGKEAVLSINTQRMQKTWFGVSRNPFSTLSNVPIPNIIALFAL